MTYRLTSLLRGAVLGLTASGLVAVLVLLLLPPLIPGDPVRVRINEQVHSWTGGALELGPETQIAAQPFLRAEIAEPTFVPPAAGEERDWRVSADAINARLRFMPLLLGRVEIVDLRLLRPDITLLDSASPLGLPGISGVDVPPAAMMQPTPPGDIVLIDGVVRLGNVDAGDDDLLSDIDLRLSRPSPSEGMVVNAAFVVDDRRVHVDLEMETPLALSSTDGTPGRLSVRLGPHLASSGGDLASQEDTQLLDDLGDRLHAAVIALGLPAFDAIVVDGQFSLHPHAVAINDATVTVGDLTLDGQISLSSSSTAPLAAQIQTLAEGAHTAIWAAAREIRDGNWPEAPVSLSWLDGLDIDLSLSGEAIEIAAVTVDRASLSFTVNDGAARLDLAGRSEEFGNLESAIIAQVGPTDMAPEPQFAFHGDMDDVSVGPLAQIISDATSPPLIGTRQLPRGTLSAETRFTASGDSLGQIVDAIIGSVSVTLEDGSLTGGDVVTTLQSLRDGREFMTEEYGPLIPAAGRTPFDRIETRVDLADGAARILESTIAGDLFEIGMAGILVLQDGAMNVEGNARLLAEATSVEVEVDLPFGVGGTLREPVVAAGVPRLENERPREEAEIPTRFRPAGD
ncbi:AsmA-like C-terminal region-containing protein [Gymnodinialimonas sp. 2305UL16-5]|uniref:AsmA family protein n=1 Tax=Gymnodinialimonas mytili TaxID=3126503 RepID=UPI0030993C15